MEALMDTTTLPLPLDKFKELGDQMVAARSAQIGWEGSDVYQGHEWNRASWLRKDVTCWLLADVSRNSRTLANWVVVVAASGMTETARRIDPVPTAVAEAPTDGEFADLLNAIDAGRPLDLHPSTLQLAQAVADMDPDRQSVEQWAQQLAQDLAKARD